MTEWEPALITAAAINLAGIVTETKAETIYFA